MHPHGDRHGAFEGVAAMVNGEHGFLHQVSHVRGSLDEALAEVGAQHRLGHEQEQVGAPQVLAELVSGLPRAWVPGTVEARYRLPILFGHDPSNGTRVPGGGTMARYRTGGTPWHVVVDPRGVVVFDGFSLDPDRAIDAIRTQLRKG
jgi:hypothetical protein